MKKRIDRKYAEKYGGGWYDGKIETRWDFVVDDVMKELGLYPVTKVQEMIDGIFVISDIFDVGFRERVFYEEYRNNYDKYVVIEVPVEYFREFLLELWDK